MLLWQANINYCLRKVCACSFLSCLYGRVCAVSPIKLIVCYRTDAFTVRLKRANRSTNCAAGLACEVLNEK